jgi:hypothetical protein
VSIEIALKVTFLEVHDLGKISAVGKTSISSSLPTCPVGIGNTKLSFRGVKTVRIIGSDFRAQK